MGKVWLNERVVRGEKEMGKGRVRGGVKGWVRDR